MPLHPWQRVGSRGEHFVRPQRPTSRVEFIAFDEQLDVAAERDPQSIRRSIRSRAGSLRDPRLHANERSRHRPSCAAWTTWVHDRESFR